jgi:hypothetical protein
MVWKWLVLAYKWSLLYVGRWQELASLVDVFYLPVQLSQAWGERFG